MARLFLSLHLVGKPKETYPGLYQAITGLVHDENCGFYRWQNDNSSYKQFQKEEEDTKTRIPAVGCVLLMGQLFPPSANPFLVLRWWRLKWNLQSEKITWHKMLIKITRNISIVIEAWSLTAKWSLAENMAYSTRLILSIMQQLSTRILLSNILPLCIVDIAPGLEKKPYSLYLTISPVS